MTTVENALALAPFILAIIEWPSDAAEAPLPIYGPSLQDVLPRLPGHMLTCHASDDGEAWRAENPAPDPTDYTAVRAWLAGHRAASTGPWLELYAATDTGEFVALPHIQIMT
jgi:hypothetical protein